VIEIAEKEYLLGNKSKDLLIYTMKVTQNTNLFPKSVRFTFAHELQNTAKDIMKNILAANECFFDTEHRRRLELVGAVLNDCNYMLTLLDVCVELEYIDLRRCEHWSGLVLNVKYMTMAWRKKDTERAKYLIEQEERQNYEKQKALIREVVAGITGCHN
jgi:hypothetical protein